MESFPEVSFFDQVSVLVFYARYQTSFTRLKASIILPCILRNCVVILPSFGIAVFFFFSLTTVLYLIIQFQIEC